MHTFTYPHTHVHIVASQQLIALSMGLPAVLLSIALLELKGPKWLQTVGFSMITCMFVLMACTFNPLNEEPDLLFAIYCLLLFSLSFGPNVTTYIMPARVYPKEVRTTFNGVSAACGKLGAVVGVYMFSAIADSSSYPVVMVVSALISLVGALVSHNFIRESET
jgi:PHS family inorganic phosphate transporter-like MFS transporter